MSASPSKTEMEIDPKLIVKGKRLRPASRAGIDAVKTSLIELGVMQHRIHVRKKKDGKYYLMVGLHRLEAVLELDWEAVSVVVWVCTDDWALMMEIDDNLAGADMTALDTAVFLAERKRVYEKLHPETKAGVAGAVARWDAADIVSFASATAEKFGLSQRHVRRLIEVGSALNTDQLRWLREAKKPVTLADLQALSKISDDHARSQVCIKLSNGEAKSAADAVRSLKENPAAKTTVKDPVEQSLNSLRDAWKRAPKVARDRFVALDVADMTLELEEAWTLADADKRKAFFTANAAEIYDFLIAEGMIK